LESRFSCSIGKFVVAETTETTLAPLTWRVEIEGFLWVPNEAENYEIWLVNGQYEATGGTPPVSLGFYNTLEEAINAIENDRNE